MKLINKKALALASTSALASNMAQAGVTYSYYNQTVVAGGSDQLTIDLNQDGSPDYTFEFDNNNDLKPYIDDSVGLSGATLSYVLSDPSNSGLPLTPAGTLIDGSYESSESRGYFYEDANANVAGQWNSGGADIDAYVGLEFVDAASNTHFGWAHFIYNSATVEGGVTGILTLVDTGMETQPNVGIYTGQTDEPGSCPAAFIPPASETNYIGANLQLTVIATGNPMPTYQWMSRAHGAGSFTNLTDGANISGSTSNVLTIANAGLNNAGDYMVALSNNNCATVDSPQATVTLTPAVVTLSPSPAEGYAGKTIRINASYGSATAVQFQWYRNGSALTDAGNVSGSTSSNLVLSAVSTNDAGNYTVTLSNTLGVVTSAVDVVSVPTPGAPYEQAVVALGAFSHYNFNETANPASGNAVAFDFVGGLNGTYGSEVENGSSNILGPLPSDGFNGFSTANYAMLIGPTQHSAASGALIPANNLNTNAMTFVAWINPQTTEPDWVVVLSYRGFASGTATGLNYTGDGDFGYHWNDTGSTYNFDSGFLPPVGQWSMVALSVSPTNGSVYIFNDTGVLETNNAVEHDPAPMSTPGHIGTDSVDGNFVGVIDEISIFNQTLSSNQLAYLYNTAVTGIYVPPGPVTLHFTTSAGSITLTWSRGTLLEATSVTGPWTTNSATSPYTTAENVAQKFYKVLVQ